MALKRRDVVAAVGTVLVAWGAIAVWIPELRLVPLAFVAGVLLPIAYGAYLVLTTSHGAQNASLRPFIAPTALEFASPAAWRDEATALKQRSVYHEIDVLPSHSLVSLNIDAFLDLLQRDFVRSWYAGVSKGSAFPNEVDRALRTAVSRIAHRLTNLDFVQLGVTRILPIINNHLKNFAIAEQDVRGKDFNREFTDTDALDAAIASRYRNGRLHPAASLSASRNLSSQQQHLRNLTSKFLIQVLPENMTTSDSVLVLVRELVACAALLPILQTLADPDILNQMIEAYGRSVLQERKTVKKLRAALDEHSQPAAKGHKHARIPMLYPDDSERKFEKFIRSIRLCDSLSDVRRFRSEVAQQQRKEAQGRDATYLKRLEVGIKLLDQQIAKLSHDKGAAPASTRLNSDPLIANAHQHDPTLRETLYDASGLSYFMEYMDRVKLMSLVQFWIVVDGFRNPLDSEGDGAEEDSSTFTSWTSSEREDVSQIYEAYLSKTELGVSAELLSPIKSFLDAGKDATDIAYISARRAIVSIQEKKLSEMNETHFPAFKKSDLFYKWVASGQGLTALNPPKSSGETQAVSLRGHASRSSVSLSQSELRKAAVSSSDLVSAAKNSDRVNSPRRSLDDSAHRSPLFEDSDDDSDSDVGDMAASTQSLDAQWKRSPEANTSASQVEAVQARLDELVDGEPNDNLSVQGQRLDELAGDISPRLSLDEPSPNEDFAFPSKGKPSLASLGLLGPTSANLFGEDEPDPEADAKPKRTLEEPDPSKGSEKLPGPDSTSHNGDDIREAAPGDLGLAELVQDITTDIEKLERQQSILASLKKKAELTNNAAELKILQKSEADLEREMSRKQMQKQQYMVQETENSLYGKTKIAIINIMVGTEEDGREFAIYVVEIRRGGGEKGSDIVWAVARRYSEFHDLHKRLRTRFPAVRDLSFPRRQMVLTFSKDLLKKRQMALEKYLRDLLTMSNVCRSIEFRAFLSQQSIRTNEKTGSRQLDRHDFITRIYNSVTDGMEEFFGNIPALDQLSTAGQNLISAATTAAEIPTTPDPTSTTAPAVVLQTDDPNKIAEAQAELNAFVEDKPTATTTFIQPISDIFLELFQLSHGNSWLRGRAVVVVLQQLLGGTVERRVREAFKNHTTEQSVVRYLALLKDTIFPDGKFRQAPPPRSTMEKAKSKREAGLILATLLPDMAGSVVGKTNAAKAGRRIFAAMNNETLNIHLFYTIFDELIDVVFEAQ